MLWSINSTLLYLDLYPITESVSAFCNPFGSVCEGKQGKCEIFAFFIGDYVKNIGKNSTENVKNHVYLSAEQVFNSVGYLGLRVTNGTIISWSEMPPCWNVPV